MNIPLIKYNISYYAKTWKFIAPSLAYIVFLSVNYQTSSPIWSNTAITAIATFVLANWFGASFINSEDKTQGHITRLHVKNDTIYHMSKVVSILVCMLPFYVLLIFWPIMTGLYARSLTFTEIIITLVLHFLYSLMGTAISIFFNSDLHKGIKNTLHLQALTVLIIAMPWAMMFDDNVFVRYGVYILPPVNFLSERLHELNNYIYTPDAGFLLFVLYSLGYSLVLIAVYNWVIKKKHKQG